MSSHDGSRGEDGFYNNSVPAGGDMPLPLPHQLSPIQSQAAASGAIPPQIMWQPPPLLNQQYIHHQAHAQVQPQQQQQQYNELFYNMHAQAFATPNVQPETYSVLPVGHGNFLKVYHRAEGGPAVSGASDAMLYQQQFQQQQQHQLQQQFHLPTPQTQPMFNSYELFSSNTLMPTPENSNIANAAQSVAASDLSMPPPQLHLLGNNTEMHSTAASTSTTNMIINKLVNNWSPNLTGGTYAQFSSTLGQVSAPALHNNSQNCAPLDPQQLPTQMPSMQPPMPAAVNTSLIVQDAAKPVFKTMSQTVIQPLKVQPAYLPQDTQPTSVACASVQEPQQSQQNSVDALSSAEVLSSKEPTAVVAPTSHATPAVPLQSAEGSKKRIVAEVKPMRMTYSDVLSKFNNKHDNQTALPVTTVKSNSNRSAKQTASSAATAQTMNERKTEQKRVAEANTNVALTQRQSSFEEPGSPQMKPTKKSPTHDNKENIVASAKSALNNKQRLVSSAINQPTLPKNSQKPTQKSAPNDMYGGVCNKKRNKKSVDVDYNGDRTTHLTNKINSSANGADKDFNGFYNVTAKNTENGGSKSSQNTSSSSNNFRRTTKSSTYATASAAFTQNYSRNTVRSSNGSVSSSYSYSTRRSRGGNTGALNSNSNRNYELAKKFLHAWFEYTIKILTWLFYLVYDIVVLGFSMAYERLSHCYTCGFSYFQQLHKDFKQNSNRPNIALKNYLRRFDARFKKNSRWAFWRRFYKKKTAEASSDFYKNGRLPQTGEEAMYSLLNCKGKDAYSILGVPSDSSQEQIRKHYKKIAVLVHPDKNKQAGAEEAFKVLQRAFELIGEPENRVAYDRSLDEALHAEKAWTELHDLLSQLQTKITEAANTIRCSTCGLRHPRKLTDRPHYAARECASCKIRHSAREGDIWAETTLMGLRWKYLALMEGKVYDITEWANCQKGALSHLEPNSHMVQYRIVRGAQQHQQQQQQMHQQHQQQAHAASSHQQFHHSHPQGSNKYKRDIPPNEASLHEFLDNLYSGQHPGGQPNSTAFSGSTRKRTRRN